MRYDNMIVYSKYSAILFCLTIWLIPFNSMKACSCIAPSSFCESLADFDGNIYAEIIIRGRVRDTEDGMKEVQVIDQIYGDLDEDQLTIGYDICTLDYNGLEDGGQYIIALNRGIEHYALVGCTISFLRVINNQVVGEIAPGVTSVDYRDLFDVIRCNDVADQIGLSRGIRLYPNPNNSFIRLNNISTQSTYEDLQLSLFNISGQKVLEESDTNELNPESSWTVDISHLPRGVYIVQLSNNFQRVTYKMMKI